MLKAGAAHVSIAGAAIPVLMLGQEKMVEPVGEPELRESRADLLLVEAL